MNRLYTFALLRPLCFLVLHVQFEKWRRLTLYVKYLVYIVTCKTCRMVFKHHGLITSYQTVVFKNYSTILACDIYMYIYITYLPCKINLRHFFKLLPIQFNFFNIVLDLIALGEDTYLGSRETVLNTSWDDEKKTNYA